MSGVDATTIRRLAFPTGVSHALRVSKSEKELSVAPAPMNCSYKFAASVQELDYVARRVIHDDLRALELQAPPGIGKSTRFPIALSELTNDRIFVLQPTECLAQAQVATLRCSGKTASFLGESSVIDFRLSKTPGVIYTTPGVFLAFTQLCFVVSHRYVGEPSRYIVIHDECHENDGATYTLRSLWPKMACVARYIKTSATTGGDRAEARQRHNGAHKLVVKKYTPREEYDIGPDDVTSDKRPCPWSVSSLVGKRTLMFIEDDRVARNLGERYSSSIPVAVLRRNDSYRRYVETQEALEANPTMLVIVDSGYQTGYTFNVDVVIDLGVRRQTIDDGSNVLGSKYRIVTASERRQRVERAARFKPGIAYVPDERAIESDSVLAPGELGHAAAWFQIFGYQVPPVLRVPAVERIPAANLLKFFAAGMPWTYWQREAWAEHIDPLSADTSRTVRLDPEEAVSKAEVPRKEKEEVSPPARRPDNASVVDKSRSDGLTVAQQSIVPVPRPIAVQPAVDIYTWAKRTAEDPKINLLGRGNFLRLQGDHFPNDPAGFAETLATDGDRALRWLENEILGKTPERLKASTAIDGIIQWTVWLAAWNHNEAANIVATWHEVRGSPVKHSPPWPPGLRIYDTRIYDVYSAIRWLLASMRETLNVSFPRKLRLADGRVYIQRGLRVAQYNAGFWQRVNRTGLRQVDAVYRKMAGIAAERRKQARTVDSSSSEDNVSSKALEISNERFSEVFQ